MAIKEHFTTRVTHESALGTTMERTFTMTFADYDNVFDIFIGNLLGDSALDIGISSTVLRVTDIKQRYLNNTDTHVTVFYSSANVPNTQAVPDASSSWTESFDISTVEEAVTTYIDAVSGDAIDWEQDWADNKPEGASDTAPELIIRRPHNVFTVSMYGTRLDYGLIMSSLGKINSGNFIQSYFAFPPQSDIATDGGIGDALQWQFTACPVARVAQNTWRYDFTFEYSGDLVFGWNDVDGLEVVRYQTMNLNSLFNSMDNIIDTDVSVRTGR